MLAVHIPAGALFYGTPRRRADVAFDAVLRRATEDAAARLHALLDSGTTPPPGYGPKCRNCSLVEVCMPRAAVASHSARGYLEQALHS
jgi:CRISPR-associated exonuclease Cas4